MSDESGPKAVISGKNRPKPNFSIPSGDNVFIHQAFRCCPYAGLITSKIHDYVEMNGYTVVDEPVDATVQVINTCGYNDTRSQAAFDAIRTVRTHNPDSAVVVTGCLTRIEPKQVAAALEGVERQAMLGPKHLEELDIIFDNELTTFEETPTAFHKDRYSSVDPRDGLFQITVSTGCLGLCKFCAIRRATGRPKSLTLEKVVDEVKRGIDEGNRDFFLASTDLSAWGHDHGLSVVDLLGALSEIDEDVLFSGEAFEPTLINEHIDELLPIFASGKFAWLVFPVQSGSQRILDLMRRTYDIDETMENMARIKQADPRIITCTDIIYGYADETWDEFLLSVKVGRQFDYAKYNNYEPRPGTPPLTLPPEALIRRREFVMEELGRQGLEIDVLTARRIRPYTGSRGKGDEHVTPEMGAWLADYAGRFARIITRRGGLRLGRGWMVKESVSDERLRAVRLEAKGPGGAAMTLALTRPEHTDRFLAGSDRFVLFVHAEGDLEDDADRTFAVDRLIQVLELDRDYVPPVVEEDETKKSTMGTTHHGKDKWSSAPEREMGG